MFGLTIGIDPNAFPIRRFVRFFTVSIAAGGTNTWWFSFFVWKLPDITIYFFSWLFKNAAKLSFGLGIVTVLAVVSLS